MPDNKQLCKSCKTRHPPPMGKKRKRKDQEQSYELSSDAAVTGSLPASQAAQAVQSDGQRLQAEILQQLKKVTERLDQVEQTVAVLTRSSTPSTELSTDSFLENIRSSKRRKCKPVNSSSSSDESDDPTLEVLKSHQLQQKVDKRIKQLVESSHLQGNQKFKSQRGGEVDVQVKHKIHCTLAS